MTDEFVPPKHVKPWIVCAANRHGWILITGPRHFDKTMGATIDLLEEASGAKFEIDQWEQGFIDQRGRFYDRREALKAVRESGQPFNAERNGDSDMLFSEGLY